MDHFKLSDLVMLQMVGGLQAFNEALISGGDVKKIIESARKKSTTPELFSEIVRKTISTQFSEASTSLRELGQNARDSYDEKQNPKKIHFSSKSLEGSRTLAVRDYGVGMDPTMVLRNLLIPYNSGKEFDPSKIGEHGIGWFSVLDVSDKVITKTGFENKVTEVELFRDQSEWKVSFKITPGNYKGTEISMLVGDRLDDSDVERTLSKHLGFAHCDEVDLRFNDVKLNTRSSEFKLGGESVIRNKGIEGILGMYVSEEPNANRDNIVLTQKGLHVKDIDNPFGRKTLHHDFFRKLTRAGLHFWIDLPPNVGLTKGRNGVIAEDWELAKPAIYSSFEQTILDVILEDQDVVKSIDLQLTEILEKLFANQYESLKNKTRTLLLAPIRNSSKRLLSGIASTFADEFTRTDDFYGSVKSMGEQEFAVLSTNSGIESFIKIPKEEKSNVEKLAEERRKERVLQMAGFSKLILSKKFIPANIKGSGPLLMGKVSVQDLIVAYNINSLHTLQTARFDKPGIYVNGDNMLVSAVRDMLNKDLSELDKLEMERIRKLEFERKVREEYSRMSSSSSLSSPRVSSSRPPERDSTFSPTKKSKFEKLTQSRNLGWEYLFLFNVAEHLDLLMSQANDSKTSRFYIHNGVNSKFAIHEKFEMSFNLNSWVVHNYVEGVHSRKFSEEHTDSIIELLLYNKARSLTPNWNEHTSTGNNFYVGRKKRIRDNFVNYVIKNGVDPLNNINGILQAMPESEKLTVEDLKLML